MIEGRRLEPADVVEVPDAIVDEGTGEWPPIVDPGRLIPAMWHMLNELAAEVHAIEATFGVNPHGTHATVADRLTAIEARLPPVVRG